MGLRELVAEAVGACLAWVSAAGRRLGIPASADGSASPCPRPPLACRGYGVAEAKFFLGPGPLPGPDAEHEAGELPATYGIDRLVLMARDPWCLFVYWEVTPATRRSAAPGTDLANATAVLRVYDVTFLAFTGDNAWRTVEVAAPLTGSTYVEVSRPAGSYCAEIGLRTASGRFVPLVRSATIATPRAGASPDQAERWIAPDEGLRPGPQPALAST